MLWLCFFLFYLAEPEESVSGKVTRAHAGPFLDFQRQIQLIPCDTGGVPSRAERVGNPIVWGKPQAYDVWIQTLAPHYYPC